MLLDRNRHPFLYTLTTIVILVSTSSCVMADALKERRAMQNKFPEFSWDHIPRYMHVWKQTSYTDGELEFLADFPLITFEKAQGTSEGSVQEGTLKAARAVLEISLVRIRRVLRQCLNLQAGRWPVAAIYIVCRAESRKLLLLK